jgi:hypothetical protein
VHQVPKEDAAVKPVGGLKKRHRGWHIAAGRRRKLKEWTQGKDECRKNFTVARKRMTRRARVARRKGHYRRWHGQDNVVRGAQKGQTLGRRQRTYQEGSTETRDGGLRQQLRSKRGFTKTFK